MLTYLVTVGNNTQLPVALAVKTRGTINSILVMEDPSVANWPTTGFTLTGAAANSAAIQKVKGTAWQYPMPGGPPATFGYGYNFGNINTLIGTTSFQVTEMP